jgi:hypothetical protein
VLIENLNVKTTKPMGFVKELKRLCKKYAVGEWYFNFELEDSE